VFWSLPTFFHAEDAGAFTGLKATTRAVDPQAAMMAADITASSSSSAETAAAGAAGAEGADAGAAEDCAGAAGFGLFMLSIAEQTCFIPIITSISPTMTMKTMLKAMKDIMSPPGTPTKYELIDPVVIIGFPLP